MTFIPTSIIAVALLIASARFTISSALYFLCFLYLVAHPIVLAPVHSGESRLRIPFWIVLVIISTAMIIAHIAFQSFVGVLNVYETDLLRSRRVREATEDLVRLADLRTKHFRFSPVSQVTHVSQAGMTVHKAV